MSVHVPLSTPSSRSKRLHSDDISTQPQKPASGKVLTVPFSGLWSLVSTTSLPRKTGEDAKDSTFAESFEDALLAIRLTSDVIFERQRLLSA